MIAALVAEKGQAIAREVIVELAGRFGLRIPDAGEVDRAVGLAESWETCATEARRECSALRRQAGEDASTIATVRAEARLLEKLAESFQIERDEARQAFADSEMQRAAVISLFESDAARLKSETFRAAAACTDRDALYEIGWQAVCQRNEAIVERVASGRRERAAVDKARKLVAEIRDVRAETQRYMERMSLALNTEGHDLSKAKAIIASAESRIATLTKERDMAHAAEEAALEREARALEDIARRPAAPIVEPVSPAPVSSTGCAVFGTPAVESRYEPLTIRLAKRMPPAPSMTLGSTSSASILTRAEDRAASASSIATAPPVQLPVLQVDQLHQLDDAFHCRPFTATVRAGTCLERQALASAEPLPGSSRAAREVRSNRLLFAKCRGCSTGLLVAGQLDRVGAVAAAE